MLQDKYYEYEHFENLELEEELLEDCKFIECEFKNCTFEKCTLLRCVLSECRFYNCKILSLQSEYSQVKYLEFKKCSLIGLSWHDLLDAGGIMDPFSILKECFMKYNIFVNMNFKKFDFSDSFILDSMFDDCILAESSFRRCQLEQTQFINCDLKKSDFREATGYQIDITSNKLKNAKFSFPEVVNLLKALEIKIE